MPLLKFVYDDRDLYVIKRGNKIYNFDPTCLVESQNDIREFLQLRPKTFEIATGEGQCPFCNYIGKVNKAGTSYFSLMTHIRRMHNVESLAWIEENPDPRDKDKTDDTSRDSDDNQERDQGQSEECGSNGSVEMEQSRPVYGDKPLG